MAFSSAVLLVFISLSAFIPTYAQGEETSTEIATETSTQVASTEALAVEPSATLAPSETPTLELSENPTETPSDTPTETTTPTETETSTETATPTTTVSPTETTTPTPMATLDCAALGLDAEVCAAVADGSARVIVQLNVSVQPVAQLNERQEDAQEERIEEAQEEVSEDLEQTDAEVVREFETLPFMAIEVDQEALAELAASPLVEDIQIDVPRPVMLAQSVPLIEAPAVWNLGFDGDGQTVAILDTGIDKNHPFITAARVVAEACFSSTTASSVTICPNGQEDQIGAGAGEDCAPVSGGNCSHGTHVAGIVAGSNGSFSGVAPGANLISVQVFSRFTTQAACGGSSQCIMAWDSDITQGLEFVYQQRNNFNIAAVNMSLGGGKYSGQCNSVSPAMTTAINNLRSAGISTVIASGNSGYTNEIGFPACISSAISVGATTKPSAGNPEAVASYSNSASFLSILAPGSAITSSVVGGGYQAYNGTSMAAPHVAGVIALLKDLDPSLTVTQILTQLRTTGVTVTDSRQGRALPRVNAYDAFISLTPRATKPPLTAPVASLLLNTNAPLLSWSSVVNAEFYQVQIYKNIQLTQQERSISLSPGVLQYQVDMLADGTYYWRVVGVNEYGLEGEWSDVRAFTVDTTPPGIPSIVKPADGLVGSRGAPVHQWGAVSGASGYQLQYAASSDTGFASPVFDVGGGTPYTALTNTPTVSSLGDYLWRLRARDLAGNWGAWSTPRTVQIIAPLTVAPLQSGPANALLTNDNTVELSWAAVTWADHYEVQVGTNAAVTAGVQSFVGGVGELNLTTSALGDGVWYWRVRAWNVNNPQEAGAWSAVRNFTVDTTPPAAPVLSAPINLSIETTQTPKFQWAAASTATLYRLQVSDAADFSNVLVTQEQAALLYTLSAAQRLDLDTHYCRVQARDAAGNWGAWSTPRELTVSLLSFPKHNTFTTDMTPLLQWFAGTGALQYWVQVDEAAEGDFDTPVVDETNNQLKLQLSDLALGSYVWRLAVDTGSGWSTWNQPWTFTVSSAAPGVAALSSPANAALTNNSTPNLSWNSILGGDTYEVQIASTNTFVSPVQDVTGGTGVTSYTASSLADGVWYWRVRAKNIYGSPGAWSAVRSLTVDTMGPVAPNVLNPANNFNSRNATVMHQWSAAATATGYWLQIDEAAEGDFATPVYSNQAITTLNNTPPLQPLGSYVWRVSGRDAAGNWGAWSAPRTLNVIQPLPVAPVQTAPAVSALTNVNTPSLSWNAVTWGDVYEVQWATNAAFTLSAASHTGASGELSYILPALADGTWYWRVRAWNTNSPSPEAGAWSAARAFMVDTMAPAAPMLSAPAAAASNVGTPTFSWTKPVTATHFQLQVTESSDTNFLSSAVDTGDVSPITVMSLKPGVNLQPNAYIWRVRARDAAGNWSVWTAERALTVTLPLPAAPTQVSPAAGFVSADNSPRLTAASVPYGVNFEFQWATNAAFTLNVNTSGPYCCTEFDISPSVADGIWYWRVRMINSNSLPGASSAARTVVVDTTPPAIPNITAPTNNMSLRNVGVTHTWTSTAGASQYQIEYDEASPGDFATPVYASGWFSGTSKAVPAQALGNYVWRMRAMDAVGNVGDWSAARTLNVILPLPAAPAQSSPVNGFITNDNTPDLSWAAAANASTYQIQIANASSFAALSLMEDISDLGAGSYTAAPLGYGTYYWRVRGVNANSPVEAGAWSTVRSFMVDTVAPGVPNLSAPMDGFIGRNSAPQMSWAAVVGANYYLLEIDDDNDFLSVTYSSGWQTAIKLTPPANALPLGNFYWRVTARDAAMNVGTPSAVRIFTLNSYVPVAPVLTNPATGTLTNDNTPTFVWNAASYAATYELQVATNSAFTMGLQSFDAASSLNYTPTLADGMYYWRVRGRNVHTEEGPFSAVRTITVDTTPPAIPTFTSPAGGASVVGNPNFMWSKPATATGYQVQVGPAGGGPYVQSPVLTVSNWMPSAAQFNQLGLMEWQVRARDAAGNWSDWSAVPSQVTITSPMAGTSSLSAPANNLVTNDDTPEFAWGAAAYGVDYEVQIATNTAFTTGVQISPRTSSPYTFASALGDAKYYWRVRAYNNLNQAGAWSAAFAVTVDRTAPVVPTIVKPADNFVSRGVVAFQWSGVAGASHYQLQIDEDSGDFTAADYDSGWTVSTTVTPPFSTLGNWDWRVRARDAAGNEGTWTTVRSLSIIQPLPVAPLLTSPAVNGTTNDNTPTFVWDSVTWGSTYQIQVDNNSNFASPERDYTTGAGVTTYTPSVLADGTWYWRVRAYNTNSSPEAGVWSGTRTLIIGNYP